MIGICFLPIPWIGRAAIVGAIAAPSPGLRAAGLPAPVIPDNVWPIVASMFMFRMIIYLYELKHAKKPESLVDTLSYFFLLPNLLLHAFSRWSTTGPCSAAISPTTFMPCSAAACR